MRLPAGFQWARSTPHAPGGPDVIACEGSWVVQLWQQADSGVWLAQLDRHRHGDGLPRLRPCSSYAQGRRGAEAWVCRHQARLLREVQQARRLRDSLRLQWAGPAVPERGRDSAHAMSRLIAGSGSSRPAGHHRT